MRFGANLYTAEAVQAPVHTLVSWASDTTESASAPGPSPASIDIDDLIREAVAPRENETGYPAQPSGLAAGGEAGVRASEPEQSPAPEQGVKRIQDKAKAPGSGGADDFFIGPNSSRRGRN